MRPKSINRNDGSGFSMFRSFIMAFTIIFVGSLFSSFMLVKNPGIYRAGEINGKNAGAAVGVRFKLVGRISTIDNAVMVMNGTKGTFTYRMN